MYALTERIIYIGADDDNLDIFEGQYPLTAGISYNSYLINDDAIAVIDAVDVRRCDDWLGSLRSCLQDGRKPRYLVVQHMEPDHSGSIGAFIREYPDVTVVCTRKASEMMVNYFEDTDFCNRFMIVADGDELCLGQASLKFITAPMVHWPEVMMTLEQTDGVLFSADAFGTFAMSSGATGDAWDYEARRYYCNIVGRFGQSVQTVMKKLKDLQFSTVAPLHGPVLTENLAHYWMLYDKWSRYEAETDGVLVAYASIYGGTAEAARRIASELQLRRDTAGEVVLMDLCRHDVSYAVAESFRLNKMVLCSVTYDGGLFPAMQSFLHHLESKKLAGRTVALVENGSWAPVAARKMTEVLTSMKDTTVMPAVLTLRGRMHHSDLAAMHRLIDDLLA